MTHSTPTVGAFSPEILAGVVIVLLVIGFGIATTLADEPGPSRPVVFVSSYLERGDVSTEPRPEQLIDTIRIFAAPGEYEPATFSVRSASEFKDLRVMIGDDLKSESGVTIPKSAMEIRLVDPIESWTKRNMECYLLKKSSVDLGANTTRRFWVTVHVPDDARPGLYRSRINIGRSITELGPDLGRFQSFKTLNYELEVLPIVPLTAQETGMAFFMFNDTSYFHRPASDSTNGVAVGTKEFLSEAFQARVFEDMREHGMTTVTAYITPEDDDGKVSLTRRTEQHLAFVQTMSMLEKTKLVAPGLPVIWIWGGNYGPDVWKAVLEEGRRKGWPEIVFYVSDEPENEDRNQHVRASIRRVDDFRSRFPRYNDLRVTTGLGSSRGNLTVGHLYDLWISCMAQRIGESGMIEQAKMMGKELWTYDCMAAPVDAETDRYYFGVWAWVSGVKGCAHWAYFCQPHLSYVYPTQEDLVPSIGWEAIREGIDDYRYLKTLEQLANQARAAGRAELAGGSDEIFAHVHDMVTMDNYGAAFHEALASGVAQASAWERPRVEPELPIEAYDQMRLSVAREIQKLSDALGNP